MPNECSECGAKLEAEQKECPYCGTLVYDADEQLLTQLTAVARKYNEALAKASLIKMEKLLADDYEGRFSDGGIETVSNKKTILENVQFDKHFVSYNIHDAELLERKNDRATIYCVQTVTRRSHFETEKFEPYIERGKIGFARHAGQWQINLQNTVTIDENGNEFD
jgi:hypothetical protein